MSALLCLGAACLNAAAAFVYGYDGGVQTQTTAAADTARAAIADAQGASVGDAVLRQAPHGVVIKVDLRNIKPGVHALHVHTMGKCDPPDFKTAGAHWAPAGNEHGVLNAKGPHGGDLPNVHVLADGKVTVEFFLANARIGGGSQGLLDADGSAVVLHAGEDDYSSNPAGNSGDRIACGVVTK
jgi:superoxide dismutase, Cu-Zn family